MKYRFPKPLSECVEAASKVALDKHGMVEARLIRHWDTILGRETAAKCLPQSLRFAPGKRDEGVLTLLVESAYALDIQHSQPLILEKLAVYFGYRAVTQLRIKQGIIPPRAKKAAFKVPAVTTTPPPLPDTVTDPELRKALEGLAQALHSAQTHATMATFTRKDIA